MVKRINVTINSKETMNKDQLDNLFDLKNKNIVVTGALGLLGKMHCEAIAKYGGNPIVVDIKLKEAKKFSEELNNLYGVNSRGFSVDITNEDEIEQNLIEIKNSFFKLDGLINNAAINPKMEDTKSKNFSRLENFSIDNWMKDLSVGLTGAFLCSKHYGSFISENSSGGSIINISSDLGLIAPDQRLYKKENIESHLQDVKPVTYSVIKSGLIGLTRYLSTYWAENNVRCNAICPGGVENSQPLEFIEKVSSRIPLNRLANKYEYQSTIVWMLADSSSYLNGAVISVDGGRTAW